jgi:hypothetical protein
MPAQKITESKTAMTSSIGDLCSSSITVFSEWGCPRVLASILFSVVYPLLEFFGFLFIDK